MKAKKQRNTRARAKRALRVLKLKSFRRRIMEKRLEAISKASRPKGITVRVNEKKQVIAGSIERVMWDEKQAGKMFRLNQRQKRKLWRQAPHMRRAA